MFEKGNLRLKLGKSYRKLLCFLFFPDLENDFLIKIRFQNRFRKQMTAVSAYL